MEENNKKKKDILENLFEKLRSSIYMILIIFQSQECVSYVIVST